MIRCDLVPAPATFRERDCRAECGPTAKFGLRARDYPYSYPCCSHAGCIEKVRDRMGKDIVSHGIKVATRVKPSLS